VKAFLIATPVTPDEVYLINKEIMDEESVPPVPVVEGEEN